VISFTRKAIHGNTEDNREARVVPLQLYITILPLVSPMYVLAHVAMLASFFTDWM